MTGFTDRGGFTARPQFFAPTDPVRARPVVVVVNYLGETPQSLHVADTTELGVSCWLPKSQAVYEAAELVGARARRAQGRPATLKITLPAWLALDRGLATAASEGQGSLF